MGVFWFIMGLIVGAGTLFIFALTYAIGKKDGRKEQENGNHDLD